MRILMLGNGFDVHNRLPTKYINFLHTVDFLCQQWNSDMKSAGDIFGCAELQKMDHDIHEGYEAYKAEYDSIELSSEQIQKTVALAKENLWFRYLLQSVNEDIHWIDFEKEIGVVLEVIQNLLLEDDVRYTGAVKINDQMAIHIVHAFGFFMKKLQGDIFEYEPAYLREWPIRSGCRTLDIEAISQRLTHELDNLKELLQIYLSQFVESVVTQLAKRNHTGEWYAIFRPNYVVSFNYTNTYEALFPGGDVYHIHGSTQDKLVLGIQPNEDDSAEAANTLFASFKKYFQRVVYKTDIEYLGLMTKAREYKSSINLIAMGHSLDITDEDIISELFDISSTIGIVYRNQSSLSRYVGKLVEMYGKDGLDDLRHNHGLTFVQAESEVDQYVAYIFAKDVGDMAIEDWDHQECR